MKKTFITMVAVAAIAASTLTGCKKGDTGPQGAQGANGTNGNANVKSQSSTNLNWVYNTALAQFETNISASIITQDIVDKGAVLVYTQTGNSSIQLPNSSMFDFLTTIFVDFEYSVGNVKITFSNSDLDNSIVPQSTLKFKIVAMTASARIAHPNVNGYEDIKTIYNLSE